MSLGVQAGSSSTAGSRKGALDSTGLGSATRGWRELTGNWLNLYNSATDSLTPSDPTARNTFLSGLLGADRTTEPANVGSFERLISQSGDSPLPAGGRAAVQSIASRDPYDGSYETATGDLFIQRVKDAMAAAGSSPNMMDGGVAARGYAQSDAAQKLGLQRAEELRRQQASDAQQTMGAAQMLDQSRQQIDQQSLAANSALNQIMQQFLASQVAAAGQQSADNATFGQFANNMLALFTPQLNESREHHETKEHQQSVSGGASCCFIFLEAYHGTMPTWVRECRDEFAPESSRRRRGYRLLAKLVVPLMRRSKTARAAVWWSMIRPLTVWGGYYKGVPGFEHGKKFRPFVRFWFKFWEVLGWL